MSCEVSAQTQGLWNWFAKLPDSVSLAVSACSKAVVVEAGATIYRQGDTAQAVYQVLEGRVQMRAFSRDGRELLYQYMEPGDCFGELGLIDAEPCHHNADAGPKTRLLKLDRADFIRLRQAHREVNEQLLQLLSKRIRLIYRTFEGALLLDVPRRLARRLLDMSAFQEGAETILELSSSHEELAKMIGSSRQSVSVIIKDWERQGWLEQTYGQIRVLSPAALEGLLID